MSDISTYRRRKVLADAEWFVDLGDHDEDGNTVTWFVCGGERYLGEFGDREIAEHVVRTHNLGLLKSRAWLASVRQEQS